MAIMARGDLVPSFAVWNHRLHRIAYGVSFRILTFICYADPTLPWESKPAVREQGRILITRNRHSRTNHQGKTRPGSMRIAPSDYSRTRKALQIGGWKENLRAHGGVLPMVLVVPV